MLASSYGFLIYAGAPWSLAFTSGVLFKTFPTHALLALYCIAFLCVMPSHGDRDGIANPFGAAGLAATALGFLIAVEVTLGLVSAFAGFQPWTLLLLRLWRYVGQVTPYAMIAFAVTLAWIAWRYRFPGDDAAGTSMPQRAAPKLAPPPIEWLLTAALVLALVACVVSFDGELSNNIPMVLIANLSSIMLPTLGVYFFLLLGLWLTVFRRTLGSSVVLLLALLPFLHWGYAHRTAAQDHAREAAEIAAVKTMVAPRIPATIVFESGHTEGLRGSWKVPAIDRVIAKGGFGPGLTQFQRNGSRAMKQSAVTALPDEYLLLKVGRASRFAKPRQIYAAAGGPLELRYVDATHDDLVAVWYRAFNPAPSRLPVLTTMGWYRGPNSAMSGDVDRRVGEFLAAALKTPG